MCQVEILWNTFQFTKYRFKTTAKHSLHKFSFFKLIKWFVDGSASHCICSFISFLSASAVYSDTVSKCPCDLLQSLFPSVKGLRRDGSTNLLPSGLRVTKYRMSKCVQFSSEHFEQLRENAGLGANGRLNPWTGKITYLTESNRSLKIFCCWECFFFFFFALSDLSLLSWPQR